jgi:hypothetical protein
MEHKGVEYTIVQSANPTRWVWTFQINGKEEKKGFAGTRPMAVVFACAAIDKAIRVNKKPPQA